MALIRHFTISDSYWKQLGGKKTASHVKQIFMGWDSIRRRQEVQAKHKETEPENMDVICNYYGYLSSLLW